MASVSLAQGQKHYSGTYRSATMREQVIYESDSPVYVPAMCV